MIFRYRQEITAFLPAGDTVSRFALPVAQGSAIYLLQFQAVQGYGVVHMIVKMKNIVLFVRDFDAAKRFYKEQLGLPLVNESPMMMEFFPGGGATLGVATAMHEAAYPLVGRHTGVTLQVKGIDDLYRKLVAAGVKFPEPLEKSPWGKMAVVADPDGNQIALVEG
jgi:predicted enzyme related to lactoylglutathione lyase